MTTWTMLVASLGVVVVVSILCAAPLLVGWIVASLQRIEAGVERLQPARAPPRTTIPRIKAQIGYRPPAPPDGGEKGPPTMFELIGPYPPRPPPPEPPPPDPDKPDGG